MGRIFHVVRKEFIQAFRDRRMFAVIFIAPILQLFLFGYAVTMDVNNITVAVMDRDRSPASRELVRSVLNSGYFTFAGAVDSDEALSAALVEARADVILVFPERFAERLDRGEPAPLQVLMDGTDSNSAGVAMGYLQKILVTYGQAEIEERVDRLVGLAGSARRPEAGINPEIRYRYNPELKSSWYMVPGVLAMILLVITMMLTSLAITREREIGTMEQLVVTPIKPWQLLAGKMIPFAIVGMIDVTLILVVAAGHFRLPMVGSVGLLYFAALVFFFTTLGMGLFISTLSHTQQQAIFLSLMVMLPSVLLSGLMFPIANMPEPVQWLTYANPLRYFLVIVRGVILKGNGLLILAPQFFMLFSLGSLVFSLAVARFHKTIE
jgi:drug efflux transport system permease protein